jgi:hypothetical protein
MKTKQTSPIQTKLKLILLGILTATSLNLPAFAYYRTVDGIDFDDEEQSYSAEVSHLALSVMSGGSYSGTNITFRSNIPGQAAASVVYSSTLTVTDISITATGEEARALYLDYSSTGTMNLNNNNTLTGNIVADHYSTLSITGSNGSVITGNIQSIYGSTINLTLSGEETKLIGQMSRPDWSGAINLTVEAGAQIDQFDGSIVNTLTLQNGAILSYDSNLYFASINGMPFNGLETDLLVLADGAILAYDGVEAISLQMTDFMAYGGTINIGDGILVDFSGVTVTEGEEYFLLQWDILNSFAVSETSFTAINLGENMTGTFTVNAESKLLSFTATAVPEPPTWFLLGTGLAILLFTAHHRRTRPINHSPYQNYSCAICGLTFLLLQSTIQAQVYE